MAKVWAYLIEIYNRFSGCTEIQYFSAFHLDEGVYGGLRGCANPPGTAAVKLLNLSFYSQVHL